MNLLVLPLFIVQVLLLAQAAYLLLLTVAGLRYRSLEEPARSDSLLRFAVLVPAHDEEELLPKLIRSLQVNAYPATHYTIFVVADNCSDATADAARANGAVAYQREDANRIGKGYALQWLLDQLQSHRAEYDAYVFLDADCEVSPNFLEAMARRLNDGHEAVQAFYTSVQFQDGPVAALRSAALTLKHHARSRGRAVLGLPCGLFGTGMAFSCQVIERHGWSTFSLTEDIEYELQLANAGIYVAFAPEAKVFSAMPTSLAQANSQNLRWERGRLRLVATAAPRLVVGAVREQSAKKLDILVEQSIPPLSVLGALSAFMVPVSFLTRVTPLAALSIATVLTLGGHVFIGLRAANVPARVYTSFLFAPIFITWKFSIYLIALLPGGTIWVRTKRSKQ